MSEKYDAWLASYDKPPHRRPPKGRRPTGARALAKWVIVFALRRGWLPDRAAILIRTGLVRE